MLRIGKVLQYAYAATRRSAAFNGNDISKYVLPQEERLVGQIALNIQVLKEVAGFKPNVINAMARLDVVGIFFKLHSCREGTGK